MSGQNERRGRRLVGRARMWLVVAVLAVHGVVASAQGTSNAKQDAAERSLGADMGDGAAADSNAGSCGRRRTRQRTGNHGASIGGSCAPDDSGGSCDPDDSGRDPADRARECDGDAVIDASGAPQAAGPPFRVTTLANQTVRMILRTSIGGRRARVKLSNAFGSTPVTIGAAHLARRAAGSAIVPESDRPPRRLPARHRSR